MNLQKPPDLLSAIMLICRRVVEPLHSLATGSNALQSLATGSNATPWPWEWFPRMCKLTSSTYY